MRRRSCTDHVLVAAANQWGSTHPPASTLIVDDVEEIEQRALGHADHSTKLARHIADVTIGPYDDQESGHDQRP